MWQACNQEILIAHVSNIIPYFLTEIQKMSLPNSTWSHTATAHMNESGMSELVYTGNQQSNKEVVSHSTREEETQVVLKTTLMA